MYIWEHPAWPQFTWHSETLQPRLDAVRLLQGRLMGWAENLQGEVDREAEMDALIQSAIRTSEIEGEVLNVESVRSSVARHLGLERAGMGSATPQTDALTELLLDATHNVAVPLTQERLCQWQAALFPQGPGLVRHIRIGVLRGEEPMQVVSGRLDRQTVHFEAPPRARLDDELQRFLSWFNEPRAGLDPLLRAGIAHLWLITLHPFDDGNGRVTRAVTDRALAQAERLSVRFYSLSDAIMARRKEYYTQLESAQKGPLDIAAPGHPWPSRHSSLMDITLWLSWFLDVLEDAMCEALARFERVMAKTRFWQSHAQTSLTERQIKVLNRLLDGAGEEFQNGISAEKYKAVTRISKATATRDLADLLEKGCIIRLPGGGRSTRYAIAYPEGQKHPE